MARRQVAIVGLDTVGIALAQALKAAAPETIIVGVDADADRRREAARLGKADRTEANFINGCREASLDYHQCRCAIARRCKRWASAAANAVVLALSPIAVEPQRWAANGCLKVCRTWGHLVLHPDATVDGEPR
jgi:threonine dehydrogenase-like Zn-dependent dehydrogenase